MRRICIFGSPGVGKSTTATKLFVAFKELHFDIELITEYVKSWAYSKRIPQDFDQVYLFAKQLHAEQTILRHVKYIITDCPIIMTVAYVQKMGLPISEEIISLSKKFELKYPSLNIFLERTDSFPYNESGRFQNLEQAKEMDIIIENLLIQNVEFFKFRNDDFSGILNFIKEKIGNEAN